MFLKLGSTSPVFTGHRTLYPALCLMLFYGIISFTPHNKEAAPALIHILQTRKVRSGNSPMVARPAGGGQERDWGHPAPEPELSTFALQGCLQNAATCLHAFRSFAAHSRTVRSAVPVAPDRPTQLCRGRCPRAATMTLEEQLPKSGRSSRPRLPGCAKKSGYRLRLGPRHFPHSH